MSPYARNHKRDGNDGPIITALRFHGWSVFPMSATGFPDLLCVRHGRVVLVEVKTPKGKTNTAQDALFPKLQAAGLELHIIRDLDGLKAAGLLKRALSEIPFDADNHNGRPGRKAGGE